VSAYIPILSAERSRLAGLAAATDTVKDRLTPLFDVPALAATPAAAAPAPTADARGAPPSVAPLEPRLAGVVDALAAAFGRRRAYLDGDAVDHRRADDGRLAAAWLFDEARAWGLPLVPVTGLRRSDGYQLAAAEAASVDRRGVCLRLQLPDFGDLEALPERVHALVDALGVAPDRVDLLVDLGRVAAEESRVLAVAARAVLGPLRRAARWRALALAAGGATPRLAAGAAANGAGVDRVPRTEWLLWRALRADTPALGFADYAGLGGDDGASAAGPAAAVATAGGPLPADDGRDRRRLRRVARLRARRRMARGARRRPRRPAVGLLRRGAAAARRARRPPRVLRRHALRGRRRASSRCAAPTSERGPPTPPPPGAPRSRRGARPPSRTT
jgi:hypothetical protein